MNIKNWHKYCVGKIFKCDTTKHSIKEDFIKGKIPYISRTAFNNGCDDFVNAENDVMTKGHCISIGAEGRYAFYQADDFATGVKVYTLRNDNLTENNALFICTILNMEVYKYNYGRARILDKIKLEEILLPYKNDKEPDWKYMDKYIKELKEQEKKEIKKLILDK